MLTPFRLWATVLCRRAGTGGRKLAAPRSVYAPVEGCIHLGPPRNGSARPERSGRSHERTLAHARIPHRETWRPPTVWGLHPPPEDSPLGSRHPPKPSTCKRTAAVAAALATDAAAAPHAFPRARSHPGALQSSWLGPGQAKGWALAGLDFPTPWPNLKEGVFEGVSEGLDVPASWAWPRQGELSSDPLHQHPMKVPRLRVPLSGFLDCPGYVCAWLPGCLPCGWGNITAIVSIESRST